MSALLPQLPKLSSLLASPNISGGTAEHSLTFLRILARLLTLDAQQVLEASQAYFLFIFDSYSSFLNLR